MPIFKAGNKLVYYAHVPRCGGMAVSAYLAQKFGPLAFHDPAHRRHKADSVWTRTSPQHVDLASLGLLFSAGFFDATFATVRHPVDRIISIFLFQKTVERSIPGVISFSEWLEDIEDRRQEEPFVFDNHIREMCDLVPQDATIFPLENGLEPLQAWIDDLAPPQEETRSTVALAPFRPAPVPEDAFADALPGLRDLTIIDRLYRRDFDRFGYRMKDWTPPSQDGPGPGLIRRATQKLKR